MKRERKKKIEINIKHMLHPMNRHHFNHFVFLILIFCCCFVWMFVFIFLFLCLSLFSSHHPIKNIYLAFNNKYINKYIQSDSFILRPIQIWQMERISMLLLHFSIISLSHFFLCIIFGVLEHAIKIHWNAIHFKKKEGKALL